MDRAYVYGGLGIVAGALVGFFSGMYAAEEKVRKRYEEAAASRMRAMELAEMMQKKRTQESSTEEIIDGIDPDHNKVETQIVGGENPIGDFTPNDENPYWTRPEVVTEVVEMDEDLPQFVMGKGVISPDGISYIEAEEYEEEDGRWKGQVHLVIADSGPTFYMDGVEIQDWDNRLGQGIIADFFSIAESNVMYVRNHHSDEDYEVIREEP